jgi:hypothetical protein
MLLSAFSATVFLLKNASYCSLRHMGLGHNLSLRFSLLLQATHNCTGKSRPFSIFFL